MACKYFLNLKQLIWWQGHLMLNFCNSPFIMHLTTYGMNLYVWILFIRNTLGDSCFFYNCYYHLPFSFSFFLFLRKKAQLARDESESSLMYSICSSMWECVESSFFPAYWWIENFVAKFIRVAFAWWKDFLVLGWNPYVHLWEENSWNFFAAFPCAPNMDHEC